MVIISIVSIVQIVVEVCVFTYQAFFMPSSESIWKQTTLSVCGFGCTLPRPLSGIAVCVVYHPPGLLEQEHCLLNEYFINNADILRNQYPNCELIFLGDFNDFQITNLLSRHNLKQLVLTPTRGLTILDLIITTRLLRSPPSVSSTWILKSQYCHLVSWFK